MSDTPDFPPTARAADSQNALDELTGGVFSAPTPGERAARVRAWIATQPSPELLGDVQKQLQNRDKAAARLISDHLNEIARIQRQDAIAGEWIVSINALLAAPTLDVAAAAAWQRDAARAGAPLSREPLSQLKATLVERVRQVEDLERRSQVQREAAVLLAQRIEVLSSKSWRDAAHVRTALEGDVQHWLEQQQSLTEQPAWASVSERFATQLNQAREHLLLVWNTFNAAIAAAQAAADNADAPLPGVPVWDDEIRVARGEPAQNQPPAVSPAATQAESPSVSAAAAQLSPAQRQANAWAAVSANLQALAAAVQAEDEAQKAQHVAALRITLRHQGRWLDEQQAAAVHEQLIAAGQAQGWQPQQADAQRTQLIEQARALLGEAAPTGRKLQDALRDLRAQWKSIDQLMPPNNALWKQFDEACTAVHLIVQQWLEKARSQSNQHRAARMALIEEVRAWTDALSAKLSTSAHAAEQAVQQAVEKATDAADAAADTAEQLSAQVRHDWREVSRSLHQFIQRWREGGHVGEKVFAEIQPLWKQAISAAEAPLKSAQKDSVQRRNALIDAARAQADAPSLDIDAIKALQQRWQAEAQAVPLERRLEQKLWEAFRDPIDAAFKRHPAPSRGAERGERRSAVPSAAAMPEPRELSAHDRAVVDAARALQDASASGDANAIRAAQAALQAVVRQAPAAPQPTPVATDAATNAAAEAAPDAAAEKPAASPPQPTRPIVAVRGDDRPGARSTAAPARAERPSERRHAKTADRAGARAAEARPARLGDYAFRLQRQAAEQAEAALRRLSAQAHGQALTQLGAAWAARDAEQLPTVAELGKLPTVTRSAWAAAIAGQVQSSEAAAAALLRLEIAADVPTPAEHMAQRRMLQLQLLTQRNRAAAPDQTWAHDVASVLSGPHSEAAQRRLSAVLKSLLKV